jgi:hypothetical protein
MRPVRILLIEVSDAEHLGRKVCIPLSFERDLVGGGSAKGDLVSHVRGSSRMMPMVTIGRYVALVRRDKSFRSWVCHEGTVVTLHTPIETVRGGRRTQRGPGLPSIHRTQMGPMGADAVILSAGIHRKLRRFFADPTPSDGPDTTGDSAERDDDECTQSRPVRVRRRNESR